MKKLIILFFTLLFTLSTSLKAQDRDHILKVYNWADYLDLDLIEEFEQWYEEQTGESVKVIYQTFDINENMLTEIEVGHEDYDVVCPSEYIIERMLCRGLLQKIDTTDFARTETPNLLSNVSPWAKGMFQEMAPKNNPLYRGETINVADYTVGYMWGTTGILYNRAFVKDEEVKSWTALQNPRFQQQIYMKDAFRDIYSVLICAARFRDIRAGNVTRNELATNLSDENIAAVEQFLNECKPQIAGWEADFGKERMCQGKVWLNATWSGDAQWAIDEEDEGVDLAYVVPKEGSNAWFDGWVIPIYAKNTRAASYWINYLCSGEHAVRNMEATGYVSVIATPEVLEAMIDEECDTLNAAYFFGPEAEAVPLNHVYYPDQSVIDRCVLMHDTADRNEAMLEMWSRVKGNNLNWKMLTFICTVLFLIVFGIASRKYRKLRRRQLRRERLARLAGLVFILLLSVAPATAFAADGEEEETEKPWGVRADVVSAYLWRGTSLGGLSFQPNAWYSFGNFSVDLWANIGTSAEEKDYGYDYFGFNETLKEFDLTLSYTLKNFEFQLIHYYYFDGNYFDLDLDNEGGNQLEATIKYNVSENLPLQFVISTNIAGADGIVDLEKSETADGVALDATYKRAYSTYIEANYTWEWEKPGMSLQAVLAATPWEGMYSGEHTAGICNISARLDKKWSVGNSTINLQATPMYSPTFEKFSWCVGVGVEF